MAARHHRRVRAQRQLGGEAAARSAVGHCLHAPLHRDTAAQGIPLHRAVGDGYPGGRHAGSGCGGFALPDRGGGGAGRHGGRLQSRGPNAGPDGGAEVPARGVGGASAGAGANAARGAHDRRFESPWHLHGARVRRSERACVPGDGVSGWRVAAGTDGAGAGERGRVLRHCAAGGAGAGGGARARDRASGHQTGQSVRDQIRAGEGDGLWAGEDGEPGRRGRGAIDRDGDQRVHVAGTGARGGPGCAIRHLLLRTGAFRVGWRGAGFPDGSGHRESVGERPSRAMAIGGRVTDCAGEDSAAGLAETMAPSTASRSLSYMCSSDLHLDQTRPPRSGDESGIPDLDGRVGRHSGFLVRWQPCGIQLGHSSGGSA